MLLKLFKVLKGGRPLEEAGRDFSDMLQLVQEMLLEASEAYWERNQNPQKRTALSKKDVKVNKLERKIRKLIIAELSGPSPSDVPYGLLMMSLVKDVERLGDYAKNLAAVPQTIPAILPEDDVVSELKEIRRFVDELAQEAHKVYVAGDMEQAQSLTVEGRSISKRCQKLLPRIASGPYSADVAVSLTLCTRFYKRIEGHLLNLLSGVIMPLHKLDYYDEDVLSRDDTL